MIVKNRLDKIFGPAGRTAGLILLLAGVPATYYSLIGLILVIFGAFIAFTTTSSMLDIENKRIKLSNDLFGIFPSGKWIDIKPEMKLGLKKTRMGSRSYSISNIPLDNHADDIRIMLFGSDNTQIMPVKKFATLESSKTELDELSITLGLNKI
jgi:hypothetical protein